MFSFCLDVNECEGESICVDDGHHTCQNLVGSYRCVCDTGYQHPENNLTLCEGKVFGHQDLQSYPWVFFAWLPKDYPILSVIKPDTVSVRASSSVVFMFDRMGNACYFVGSIAGELIFYVFC